MATFVLFLCFLMLCILKQMNVTLSYQKIGRISMSTMLFFIGCSHFFMPGDLVDMIPPLFPFPLFIVYVTGILELLFGVFLLFNKTYNITGKILIAYFILIWPANIYHAINAGDIPGGIEQYIPYYHWIRVILIQPFFILWTWLTTIRLENEKHQMHISSGII